MGSPKLIGGLVYDSPTVTVYPNGWAPARQTQLTGVVITKTNV
jgi:hypothetical protein